MGLTEPRLEPMGDFDIGTPPIARQPKQRLDPEASIGIIEGDISSVAGDRVVLDLGKLGNTTSLDSGINPDVITGYDAISRGEANLRHGSDAPNSLTYDADRWVKIADMTPPQALDAMAKVFGAPQGFVDYESSTAVNDPNAADWAGFCDELFSMILSSAIDKHLEVPGPYGERGLCVGDYWISRADLTNQLGALLGRTMTADKDVAFLYIGEENGATDQLKGMLKWPSKEGGGCVCSIWNDKAHGGEHQVWNQTFVRTATTPQADVTAQAQALLQAAGNPAGGKVVQIDQTGTYAVETDNGYEGGPTGNQPTERERNWTYYAVVKPAPEFGDNKFEVVKAFMADSPEVANLDVPTKYSDEKVAYFWRPTLNELKDLLAGARDATIDNATQAKQLRFFAAVLDRGVPGVNRDAFEKDWQALNLNGRAATAAEADTLLQKHPGIAVAYSPATWVKFFPGLDYGKFFAPASVS